MLSLCDGAAVGMGCPLMHLRDIMRIPSLLQGPFLPGYREVTRVDPFETFTPPVGLSIIDHVVGNMPDLGMIPAVEWYENVLKVRVPFPCAAPVACPLVPSPSPLPVCVHVRVCACVSLA